MGGPVPTAPTSCFLRDAPPPSPAVPSPLGPVLQLGLGTAVSDPTKSMTVVTWISITGRSTCPLLPPRCVRAHGLCHSHTAPSAVPLSPVPNGLCHSHLFPRVVPVPKGCLRVTHPHGLSYSHSSPWLSHGHPFTWAISGSPMPRGCPTVTPPHSSLEVLDVHNCCGMGLSPVARVQGSHTAGCGGHGSHRVAPPRPRPSLSL